MGYYQAGFDVVGVDINPQPNYPFEFIQGDVLEVMNHYHWFPSLPSDIFDAIHASPPCQAFTVYGNNRAHVRQDHPDLVDATRQLLRVTGLPYVIENVPGAPLHNPIQLCGTSFGIPVRRHRIFESNVSLMAPPCAHGMFTERRYPGSSNRPNGRTVCNVGEWRVPLEQQHEAMEIDWMTLPELSQAIPPSYTEFIGQALAVHLAHKAKHV